MRTKTAKGNRIAALLTALLVAVGLTALLSSAVAGADAGATVAKGKKKKKTCKAGTHKVTVKKKNGKKKKKCVPDAAPAPAGPTTLGITPATFTFPDGTQHGDTSDPQAFTVTNTGGAPSGVPAASITETKNPIPGDPPGFAVSANGCTAALPAGGSCTVSVVFQPTSNAGDALYTAVLHVTASPGSDAAASLSGTAD
jgi:hypothetical protein